MTNKIKPIPATFYVYVPDTDATYQRVAHAGDRSLREPRDEFYGGPDVTNSGSEPTSKASR